MESADEYEALMKKRPHLVILGAGASVAAIPHGDANGKKTSVMNGFIDMLNMRDLFKDIRLNTSSENLEDIYTELSQRSDCSDLLGVLNDRIYNYYFDFQIPHTPTIYDYLLIALTKKDAVASFNWDPLLLQAYQRVSKITKDLPELIFLHGNVYVGICKECKRGGFIQLNCPDCGKNFQPVPLLYPVANKNYDDDIYIRDSWNALRWYLKGAFMLTIFGYSAPKTDSAAVAIFKDAWGETEKRALEQIEIIDIKPETELVETWNDFIHTHHYEIHSSFFDSFIAKFPRQSCEKFFDMAFNCEWLDGSQGIKENTSFKELERYVR